MRLLVIAATLATTVTPLLAAPRRVELSAAHVRAMARQKPPPGGPRGKMSGRLRDVLERPAPPDGAALVPTSPASADGRLPLYVRFDDEATLASLRSLGAEVDVVDRTRGVAQVRVPPAALDDLASLPAVQRVELVDRARPRVGSVTTEGDAGSGADVVRADTGLDGTGVRVGVISDGIDSLAEAQASADLATVSVPTGCPAGAGDEGTALLEIVHDLAPGAELLFAGPGTSLEMVQAVECLADAGADVIVDDLGFYGEPYFEDGPVAQAAAAAVARGVSFHSAAGNSDEEHFEDDFRASPDGDLHDFDAGTAVDNTLGLRVAGGGELLCVLQWNDPFGASGNDYELILLDDEMNEITRSDGTQDGTQDPLEAISVTNRGNASAAANVVVERYAGEARRLKLFCLGGEQLEYASANGSIFGHPAVSEVIAVGAIDQADPGRDTIETYSSTGPAHLYLPAETTRAKPDLAALDGVSISNAGGFPSCPPYCTFYGTSAAAPHSAAAAALLLQRNPSLTPAVLQALLRQSAVDVGPAGTDAESGAGRLDVAAALPLATDPPSTCDELDCDDGDPCTQDVCSDATCSHGALTGLDGATCVCERAAPDACSGQSVPTGLARKAERACAKLARAAAETKDKRARHLATAAARLWKRAARQVAKPAVAQRLDDACIAALAASYEDAQARAAAVVE